jgi:hypothetical protein
MDPESVMHGTKGDAVGARPLNSAVRSGQGRLVGCSLLFFWYLAMAVVRPDMGSTVSRCSIRMLNCICTLGR